MTTVAEPPKKPRIKPKKTGRDQDEICPDCGHKVGLAGQTNPNPNDPWEYETCFCQCHTET